MWRLIIITLGMFILVATIYLGKCAHRHWTSRSHHIINTNSVAPNAIQNECNPIDCYEQIHHVEYEDPQRYLDATSSDGRGISINNSSEKMDTVAIVPFGELSLPSTVEALNVESASENVLFQNQYYSEAREIDDLYLTPSV